MVKNTMKYIKSNKLNAATYFLIVIEFIVYVCRLGVEIKANTELKDILSMSADYVTVCSCIIVVIQALAFFNDARHKEYRSKKEAALDIARQYVDILTKQVAFIQSVLSYNYSPTDPNALSRTVLGIDIYSERFVKSSLNKHSELSEYTKIFAGKEDVLDVKELLVCSITYDDALNIKEVINNVKEDEQKHAVNVKFRVLVSNTMNTLEYFAMAVNQNVAESEMLFSSLHQTFLKFVHFMYPMVCLFNDGDTELFYPNVIKLYRKWHEKEIDIESKKSEAAQKTRNQAEKSYNWGKPL